MDAVLFYGATLAIFFCIFNIMAWGLNIQFGYAGILDFAFITFVAAGGYFAGVAMLGPAATTIDRQYILGLNWPFLAALVLAGAIAGALGALVGLVVLHRLRSDYSAIVTVALATIALDFVGNYQPLFNGFDGIAGVPSPFNSALNLDPITYNFFYIVVAAVAMTICGLVARRIGYSPLGRTMRAVRDDADVAAAFGKRTFSVRMTAMVVGSVYAGIAGALLVGFIGSLNPGAWAIGETILIWTAMLVGGRGNNLGMMVGVFLIIVVFNEATRFLPPVPGHPGEISAVRNMIIGSVLILVLWFRPQGVVPERKRTFDELTVDAAPAKVEAARGL